jgi:hypothetical protein
MIESACKAELRKLITTFGYSIFWRDVKELNRERVSKDRPERIKVSNTKKAQMYRMQRGLCSICNKAMVKMPGFQGLDVDHKDVHAQGLDYNADINLGLAHASCNRSKSSKSLEQMSKQGGKTFVQQLTREVVDPNEL